MLLFAAAAVAMAAAGAQRRVFMAPVTRGCAAAACETRGGVRGAAKQRQAIQLQRLRCLWQARGRSACLHSGVRVRGASQSCQGERTVYFDQSFTKNGKRDGGDDNSTSCALLCPPFFFRS